MLREKAPPMKFLIADRYSLIKVAIRNLSFASVDFVIWVNTLSGKKEESRG